MNECTFAGAKGDCQLSRLLLCALRYYDCAFGERLNSIVVRVEDVHFVLFVQTSCPRLVNLTNLSPRSPPCSKEFTLGGEFLYSVIAELADVQKTLLVKKQIVRVVELARPTPYFAPCCHKFGNIGN